MGFCVGIVLYNPSMVEIERVNNLALYFEKIYIFDNSIIKYNASFNEKCTYITRNKNVGLSIAYNELCSIAIKDMFDYIFLLDQDSQFSIDDIKDMENRVSSFENSENIGIFLPTISYEHKSDERIKESSYRYVEWGISSGSCLNLEIYSNSEKFDEYLFIDRVDYDYCLMLNELGYKIVQFNDIILKQKLGEVKSNGNKVFSEHSSSRYYYMSRNRWYVNLKHFGILKGTFRAVVTTFRQIIIIIRLESEKKKKIINLLKGIIDFIKKR
ncbi:glycosyltransferase [Enterococcus italicus]